MLEGYLYAFQRALERAISFNRKAAQVYKAIVDFKPPVSRTFKPFLTLLVTNLHNSLEAIEEIREIFDKIQKEVLSRLTEENAGLEEQLAELRRRELTYLSLIKEAQASATYSPSPEDKEILLNSYHRQRTILLKNLTRHQEAKAQYGLDVPVSILNAIDQTQEDLEQIDANIAALEEASKTETS